MELLGPRARTFARLLLYMLQNAFQKDAILLFGLLPVFSPATSILMLQAFASLK